MTSPTPTLPTGSRNGHHGEDDDYLRAVLADDPAAPQNTQAAFERDVAAELHKQRVRAEVQRRLLTEPDPAADAGEDPRRIRVVSGGAFIHDAPDHVPALWGHGDEVLWAEGEPLMLTGPTGVGKTTLGGQIVAGRLGLLDGVLGHPVRPGARRTLYLAMDRPAQISRSLGRLLRTAPREVLDERLVVWKGPPPCDLARNPSVLLALADEHDADTVVVDSLKDAASKLTDEETGQGFNSAMQNCVAAGVEVLVFHHQRKAQNGQTAKPTSIADVYGSAWLTAGCGSVVLLWGAGGDPIVELSHLKQPAETVGPLKVRHDHTAGRSYLFEHVDLASLLTAPVTAREVAMRLADGGKPASAADVERARRKLDGLVRKGDAQRLDGGAGKPVAYISTAPEEPHARPHG